MEKPASSGTGKRSARGQAQQQTIKGCSCKRSQCIKNYCDCYQSMTVCSTHCRCIGCRNTQERKNVTPPAKGTAAKRDRGAALTAKVAAAAAKAAKAAASQAAKVAACQAAKAAASQAAKGSAKSVATKMVPQPAAPPPKTTPATALVPSKASEQSSIKDQQEPKVGVSEENTSTATLNASVSPGAANAIAEEPETKEEESKEKKPGEPAGSKVFFRPINVALFDCMFAQAIEGEQMGLNEVHIGHLVFHELTRAINTILADDCLE